MQKSDPPSPPRTVVLGLGNPIVSDDAVGLHVVRRLVSLLSDSIPEWVEIKTSQRAGFELIDLLAGAERAIIVDCLELPDPVPGRVRTLTLSDVSGSVRLVGVHEVTVATAFEFARMADIPMPSSVLIYAVEGQDMRTISESMTPSVAAVVEPLAIQIAGKLREFSSGQPDPMSAGTASPV